MSVAGRIPIAVAAAKVRHGMAVRPAAMFKRLKGTTGIKRKRNSHANPCSALTRSSARSREPPQACSPSRPSRRVTQKATLAPRFAPIVLRTAPHTKPNTAPPASVSTAPEKSSAVATTYSATNASGAHHDCRSSSTRRPTPPAVSSPPSPAARRPRTPPESSSSSPTSPRAPRAPPLHDRAVELGKVGAEHLGPLARRGRLLHGHPDARHFRFREGHPRNDPVVHRGRERRERVPHDDLRHVVGDVGELQAARDVP